MSVRLLVEFGRVLSKYWGSQNSIRDDRNHIVDCVEKQCKRKHLKFSCSKLGLSVAVYHIWSHRNAIIFQRLIKQKIRLWGSSISKSRFEFKGVACSLDPLQMGIH